MCFLGQDNEHLVFLLEIFAHAPSQAHHATRAQMKKRTPRFPHPAKKTRRVPAAKKMRRAPAAQRKARRAPAQKKKRARNPQQKKPSPEICVTTEGLGRFNSGIYLKGFWRLWVRGVFFCCACVRRDLSSIVFCCGHARGVFPPRLGPPLTF